MSPDVHRGFELKRLKAFTFWALLGGQQQPVLTLQAIYLLEQSLRYGLRDLDRAEAFKAEKSGRPIAVKKQDYGAQWRCYDVEVRIASWEPLIDQKEYALQLYREGRLAVVRAST